MTPVGSFLRSHVCAIAPPKDSLLYVWNESGKQYDLRRDMVAKWDLELYSKKKHAERREYEIMGKAHYRCVQLEAKAKEASQAAATEHEGLGKD